MKYLFSAILCAALCGCATQATFFDKTTGAEYKGATNDTFGSTGAISADIDNDKYSGSWIYSSSGGAVGFNAAQPSSVIAVASTSGGGKINMKAESGKFIRCSFGFDEWNNTGSGLCQRNDGREYDLYLKR